LLSFENRGRETFLVPLFLVYAASAGPASFYTQPLKDPKAVYVTPSGHDDTAALQKAVDQVQNSVDDTLTAAA
jgi:hypothetical protein